MPKLKVQMNVKCQMTNGEAWLFESLSYRLVWQANYLTIEENWEFWHLSIGILFDIWILTFGIAVWVAQRNLGDRALGRAQKSGNCMPCILYDQWVRVPPWELSVRPGSLREVWGVTRGTEFPDKGIGWGCRASLQVVAKANPHVASLDFGWRCRPFSFRGKAGTAHLDFNWRWWVGLPG